MVEQPKPTNPITSAYLLWLHAEVPTELVAAQQCRCLRVPHKCPKQVPICGWHARILPTPAAAAVFSHCVEVGDIAVALDAALWPCHERNVVPAAGLGACTGQRVGEVATKGAAEATSADPYSTVYTACSKLPLLSHHIYLESKAAQALGKAVKLP